VQHHARGQFETQGGQHLIDAIGVQAAFGLGHDGQVLRVVALDAQVGVDDVVGRHRDGAQEARWMVGRVDALGAGLLQKLTGQLAGHGQGAG